MIRAREASGSRAKGRRRVGANRVMLSTKAAIEPVRVEHALTSPTWVSRAIIMVALATISEKAAAGQLLQTLREYNQLLTAEPRRVSSDFHCIRIRQDNN
jgi:hypothetical protein